MKATSSPAPGGATPTRTAGAMRLDHVTLRTGRLAETRDFLLQVFPELQEGKRPSPIAETIPGHWLYADGAPIIHLIGGGPATRAGLVREGYDHAGIFLTGYETFRARLQRLAIPYSTMELAELNERRIFFETPTGILIETVFRE